MPCEAIWRRNVLHIGNELASTYIARLGMEGLAELARESDEIGETGGAGGEETDRHFALKFVNSAGRGVYVSTDPLGALGQVAGLVGQCFTGGELLLVDVPCGAGAGSLGLLSAIYEQRRAGTLPCMPMRVRVLGGDLSVRGREHFRYLVDQLAQGMGDHGIEISLDEMHWDCSSIISSSQFIDRAVALSVDCEQVFLLVSNFSDALEDNLMKEAFEHFLSQFAGRLSGLPNSVCWIEPASNRAKKMLPRFSSLVARLIGWFKPPASGSVAGTLYIAFDPVKSRDFGSGVSVLKADHGGMPW